MELTHTTSGKSRSLPQKLAAHRPATPTGHGQRLASEASIGMQGMRLMSIGTGTGITVVPHPGSTTGRRRLSAAIATGTSRPIAATVDGTQMIASIATAIDTHPGASTAPTAGATGASRPGHRPNLGETLP